MMDSQISILNNFISSDDTIFTNYPTVEMSPPKINTETI